MLYEDRLFLVFDHEAGSFIVALDKRTGKELWRQARDESSSGVHRSQFNTVGENRSLLQQLKKFAAMIQIMATCSGRLLAWAAMSSQCPSIRDGFVYVMSGHRDPRLMAIKLGKEGDLSGSDSIAWNHTRNCIYRLTCSP